MGRTSILDVTLRDGGCVNNFDFGDSNIRAILSAQSASGVDYVEVGYLDSARGSSSGRTQFNDVSAIRSYLPDMNESRAKYVAMFDLGKFDPLDLPPRESGDIHGIRCAFHKEQVCDVVAVGQSVMERGYDFYVQPMITVRYSDTELADLIALVNRELPGAAGFYCVDTLGQMMPHDVQARMRLIDGLLAPGMAMGLHSHNNMQMSFANALAAMDVESSRELMLDASMLGMGKGAGNLNSELILRYLNQKAGARYDLGAVLGVCDTVLSAIRQEFYWGYSLEYYLSSASRCSPTYANYFYRRHMLAIEEVAELLDRIPEERRISFSRELADELYRARRGSRHLDDQDAVDYFRSAVDGKSVVLIAPGKSITAIESQLRQLVMDDGIVSMSVGVVPIATDFTLVTRQDALALVDPTTTYPVVTSNLALPEGMRALTLDYERWSGASGSGTEDSSGAVALRLLEECGARSLTLVGFDGFSPDVNANYYRADLRRPVEASEADRRNDAMGRLISRLGASLEVNFATPSLYSGYLIGGSNG